MVSLGNPKAWIPYMNSKDCSQGFCSLYCPQWCYVIFPPPPPSPLDEFPNDSSSGPNFSPLVIAIIGILASALLLVSYYTIISKYCGNNSNSAARRSRRENLDHLDQLEVENEDHQNPSLHEPWHAATAGLDETLIKSITVCKYRKGDGLIEGTDCSVCLSEFEEGESVRLLPKCSHAFHVPCIDTWLRSHSNCPLCRANIFFISASAPLIPHQPSSFTPPVSTAEISPQGTNSHNQSAEDRQEEANENAAVAEEAERVSEEEGTQRNNGGQKGTPLRVLSDLGNFEQRNTIVEIRDGAACHQHIWRSISMDHHSCQRSHIVVSDIMTMNHNQDEAFRAEEEDFSLSGGGGGARDHVGSSKNAAEEFISKFCSRHKRRVLNCVLSPVRMKRSFSGERFLLARQGRIRESDITSPV